MAAPLRPWLPLLLVPLRDAPPLPPTNEIPPNPTPIPKGGAWDWAALRGLRLDSQTLTPGAPYKGMVGADVRLDRGPRPRAASRPGSAELRPSAESPQGRGLTSRWLQWAEPLVCLLVLFPTFPSQEDPKILTSFPLGSMWKRF